MIASIFFITRCRPRLTDLVRIRLSQLLKTPELGSANLLHCGHLRHFPATRFIPYQTAAQDIPRRVAVLIEQTATALAAVHYVFRRVPLLRVAAPGALLCSAP